MDDTLESSAAERILAEKIATFRAEYSGVYDRRELDGVIAEKIDNWRFYAQRQAQHEQRSRANRANVRAVEQPSASAPPSFIEEREAARLGDEWAQEFRAELFGQGLDKESVEGIVAENVKDWRWTAIEQVRKTGKPKVVSDKDRKIDDLMRRIDALQRDLELFRGFHGPERELDAQIVAWLPAISTGA